MRLAGLWFALVSMAAGPALARSSVTEWFPVHVGDQWLYEHTTRDDIGNGRAHLDIHAWKTEETTTGTWNVPEGTVVERRVQVVDGSPPGDRRIYPNPIFLIRGDCLYGPGYGEAEWDSAAHRLTTRFQEGLRTYSSPDFCFPLAVNETWGAPHGLPDWGVTRPEDAGDWRVERTGRRVSRSGQKMFHIASNSAYPGSGMTVDIWFEKGIGVLRQEDIHHGTIGEERTRLLRFTPAPR